MGPIIEGRATSKQRWQVNGSCCSRPGQRLGGGHVSRARVVVTAKPQNRASSTLAARRVTRLIWKPSFGCRGLHWVRSNTHRFCGVLSGNVNVSSILRLTSFFGLTESTTTA
jgi:hypothetical protein